MAGELPMDPYYPGIPNRERRKRWWRAARHHSTELVRLLRNDVEIRIRRNPGFSVYLAACVGLVAGVVGARLLQGADDRGEG